MRTLKNLLLLFLFVAVVFAAFFLLFPDAKQKTASVAGEYTGGELIDFAAALQCDIDGVTSSGVKIVDRSDSSLTCSNTLLNHAGKTVFFFDVDRIITEVHFIFPADTSWNDVSNRISEQLGEASTAALYDSGGADAQWENEGYLFYLATDGETMTLSVTKYYGANN